MAGRVKAKRYTVAAWTALVVLGSGATMWIQGSTDVQDPPSRDKGTLLQIDPAWTPPPVDDTPCPDEPPGSGTIPEDFAVPDDTDAGELGPPGDIAPDRAYIYMCAYTVSR